MKCQFYFLSYVDGILLICKCIQRNFLMLTFMGNFFLKSLWQKETQVNFFEEQLEQLNFHQQTSAFLGGHGFNILIHKYF